MNSILTSLKRGFTGPNDIGRSLPGWVAMATTAVAFLGYPIFSSSYAATNVAYYLSNIPIAFGLCLLWGYCGVLSFGQVAFYALSAYVYGIVAGNFPGETWATWVGSVAGLAASGMLAAAFGYFIFYARVAAWIIPILTLVLALLLSTFLGLTAGPQWTIGQVALGGYNGMNGIPTLQFGNFVFDGYAFYYLALVIVLLLFIGLRVWLNSHRGHLLIAIREDAVRSELLGYDVRLEQLRIFVFAAILSGISGLLYVQWGNYITPSVTSLSQAALPVIWVAVAGRDSLLAVAIATFLLNMLSYDLSSSGNRYALIIIGALLVVVMRFAPEGLIPRLARLMARRPQTMEESL